MRGKKAKIRKIYPDLKYNSVLVTKFINNVMEQGKKMTAEKIVYTSMVKAAKELKKEPLESIEKALDNIKPSLEVRPRRVGGVTYQVPLPVPESRQLSVAIKWIIEGARQRRKKEKFEDVLALEIIDAYKGTGFAMKKKEEMHKTAEANKAFTQFQW